MMKHAKMAKGFRGLLLILTACVLSLLLASCAQQPQQPREINDDGSFSNKLVVENLSIGYPAEFHEVTDTTEAETIPFMGTTVGDVPVSSSKAVAGDNVTFVLASAEPDSQNGYADIESDYNSLKETLNKTNESGYTRLSLSQERVVVNGMNCVIIDTVVAPPEEAGYGEGRAIIYVLLDDDDRIVGSVEGYFYNQSYESDPSLYDSVFASVRYAQ